MRIKPFYLTELKLLIITFAYLLYGHFSQIFQSNSDLIRQLTQKWAKLVLNGTGTTVSIHHQDRLKLVDAPCIYISNHASHFDIPILLTVLPNQVLFVAKAELGRIPLFGSMMKKLGFFLLQRQDLRHSYRVLEQTVTAISKGHSLWMAPNGRRADVASTEKWKNGAFRLACQTKVAIIPIYLHNTNSVWPKGQTKINSGKTCSVTIGQAVASYNKTPEQLRQQCWQIMSLLMKENETNIIVNSLS